MRIQFLSSVLSVRLGYATEKRIDREELGKRRTGTRHSSRLRPGSKSFMVFMIRTGTSKWTPISPANCNASDLFELISWTLCRDNVLIQRNWSYSFGKRWESFVTIFEQWRAWSITKKNLFFFFFFNFLKKFSLLYHTSFLVDVFNHRFWKLSRGERRLLTSPHCDFFDKKTISSHFLDLLKENGLLSFWREFWLRRFLDKTGRGWSRDAVIDNWLWLALNFKSWDILKIIYVIILSKYFPNSDWLKAHS